MVTPANIDDRKLVPEMTISLFGKLFGEPAPCGGSPRCSDWRTRKGDRGYIYQNDFTNF